MSRRAVVLAVAAAVAVAVAIGVVIAVSGRSHESPERKAISLYIKSVDSLQQQLRVAITGAGVVYRDLAIGKPVPASRRRELVAAAATLREIRDRLMALPAPRVARRLKTLLVELGQRQLGVAREVNDVAFFAPRYVELLGEVRRAAAALGRAFAAIPAVKTLRAHGTKAQIAAATAAHDAEVARASSWQAAAVEAYVSAMNAIRGKSRALHAPALLLPVYRAEAKAIAESVATGTALASALRAKNRTDVAARSRDFAAATRSAGAVSVQRAEVAAIKAYNARVRSIGKLQEKIRLETGRIDNATS